jgi:hypothetical protein
MNEPASPSAPAPAESPGMNPFQRVAAMFVKPADAWAGLETRAQWWFAMLLFLGFGAVSVLALHERAVLPMVLETFDRQVADGQMSAEQAAGAERFMSGPVGMSFVVIQQTVVIAAATFLSALATSFAIGFLLGGKLRYRLALEVTAWSALVTLPGQVLFFVLAWSRESLEGVHVGFGAFVPEPETPSRLLRGLTVFLDFLGPFSIWGLVVAILGAAALSGLPRKRVAWTMSGVNVVMWLLFAALAAVFGPGA